MSARPLALTVNAVTTDGGDGLLGDAAVFAELGCRPACVATSVLASSGETLHAFEPISDTALERQFEAALAAGRPAGTRVGAVCSAAQAERLAEMLRGAAPNGTVYAPLVRAGGRPLLDPATRDAAHRILFPVVRVVVVRASELALLVEREAEDLEGMRASAVALRAAGARAVIVAGLPLRGRVFDLLDDDGTVALVDAAWVRAPHVTGLGGAYAAALTAHLAREAPLLKAAESAQRYVALRLMRGR